MTEDEKLLKNRFTELSNRSESQFRYFYTDFLTLNELNILNSMRTQLGYFTLFGGIPTSEMCIACFGKEDDIGYPPEFPVKCIEISPKNMKFSDELTHRDFLGALMSLGIVRDKLGDIIVKENIAYLFCIKTIAEYICENLVSVKRTFIKCRILEKIPDLLVEEPEVSSINTSSERADAVIAAVYNLSRNESQRLFQDQLIYINAKECLSPSYTLKENEMVSVRHFGRFRYCGISKTTRKGRLMCNIRIYK